VARWVSAIRSPISPSSMRWRGSGRGAPGRTTAMLEDRGLGYWVVGAGLGGCAGSEGRTALQVPSRCMIERGRASGLAHVNRVRHGAVTLDCHEVTSGRRGVTTQSALRWSATPTADWENDQEALVRLRDVRERSGLPSDWLQDAQCCDRQLRGKMYRQSLLGLRNAPARADRVSAWRGREAGGRSTALQRVLRIASAASIAAITSELALLEMLHDRCQRALDQSISVVLLYFATVKIFLHVDKSYGFVQTPSTRFHWL